MLEKTLAQSGVDLWSTDRVIDRGWCRISLHHLIKDYDMGEAGLDEREKRHMQVIRIIYVRTETDAGKSPENCAPMCLTPCPHPVPTTMWYNHYVHYHQESFVYDRPLQIITTAQVPQHSCHQLFHLVVRGFPQQSHQGVRSSGLLDCSLVFIILTTVGQIPEKRIFWKQ